MFVDVQLQKKNSCKFFLVSDDVQDAAFDREVLLHFLIGLNPSIREMVLSAKCSNKKEYIKEAKKHFVLVKEEPVETVVKIEPDVDYNFGTADSKDDQDSWQASFIENLYQNANYNEMLEFENPLDEDMPLKDKKSKNKNFDCEECGKTFPTRKRQYAHLKKFHPEDLIVKCSYCDSTHANKHLLNLHVKENHSESKIFKCKFCGESFESWHLKQKHIEKSHVDKRKTCDICKKEFIDTKTLAKHITLKHCEVSPEGKTICVYCPSVQKKRHLEVKSHIMAVHFNEPEHVCEECGKVFTELALMKHHIRSQHLKERPYQCDKCTRTFVTRGSLKYHIAVTHDEQKPIACDTCGKCFDNEMHLKSHQFHMHKKERNQHICPDCGKSFWQKECFRIHCLTEHASAKEQAKVKVECQHPGCNYSSFLKRNVDKHYDRIHLQIKKHVCPTCGQSFAFKQKMIEHINGIHLLIKPFKCDICDFATAYRNTHYEHRKVAHGTQRFECPHCNHVARYKGNLRKHVQNVHKTELKLEDGRLEI